MIQSWGDWSLPRPGIMEQGHGLSVRTKKVKILKGFVSLDLERKETSGDGGGIGNTTQAGGTFDGRY